MNGTHLKRTILGLYLLQVLQVTLEWTLVSLCVGIICEISKKKKKKIMDHGTSMTQM